MRLPSDYCTLSLLLPLQERVATGTLVCSDEFKTYGRLGQPAYGYDHRTVNHSLEEYVRLDDDLVNVTTNAVEGFWGNGDMKVALRTRRGTRRFELEKFARVRSWRSLKESVFGVVSALTKAESR